MTTFYLITATALFLLSLALGGSLALTTLGFSHLALAALHTFDNDE